MNALIAAIVIAASLSTTQLSMSDRVTAAVQNPAKIAQVMPNTPADQARFKAETIIAIEVLPESPAEKRRKMAEVKKAFAEIDAKNQEKLLIFPVASPETFTGAMALDAASFQTNSVALTNIIQALEEIDMGYGLDRKPRTMDKSKKYYPGWRRGEDIEPGGYPCQTLH